MEANRLWHFTYLQTDLRLFCLIWKVVTCLKFGSRYQHEAVSCNLRQQVISKLGVYGTKWTYLCRTWVGIWHVWYERGESCRIAPSVSCSMVESSNKNIGLNPSCFIRNSVKTLTVSFNLLFIGTERTRFVIIMIFLKIDWHNIFVNARFAGQIFILVGFWSGIICFSHSYFKFGSIGMERLTKMPTAWLYLSSYILFGANFNVIYIL